MREGRCPGGEGNDGIMNYSSLNRGQNESRDLGAVHMVCHEIGKPVSRHGVLTAVGSGVTRNVVVPCCLTLILLTVI